MKQPFNFHSPKITEKEVPEYLASSWKDIQESYFGLDTKTLRAIGQELEDLAEDDNEPVSAFLCDCALLVIAQVEAIKRGCATANNSDRKFP